jgi:choice-of-anchor C domain-containing protein
MLPRLTAAVLTISAACAQQPGNQLSNGSFEKGANPGSFANVSAGAASIPAWTVTGEAIDYIGSLWRAADGARSIDLDGSARSRLTPPYATGGISQTFATVPGKSYLVLFDLAGNVFGGPAVKRLRVSAAGQTAELQFSIAGKSAARMGFVRTTWSFTANATSTTLEFRSASASPETGYGAVIDNVVVEELASLEEPSPAPRPEPKSRD